MKYRKQNVYDCQVGKLPMQRANKMRGLCFFAEMPNATFSSLPHGQSMESEPH
jgi:hypothetical protein